MPHGANIRSIDPKDMSWDLNDKLSRRNKEQRSSDQSIFVGVVESFVQYCAI